MLCCAMLICQKYWYSRIVESKRWVNSVYFLLLHSYVQPTPG